MKIFILVLCAFARDPVQQLEAVNHELKEALKSVAKKEKSVGGGKGRWLSNAVYEGKGAVYCGTKYCAAFDLDNCKDARKALSVDKDATDLSNCPDGWERIDTNYWGTSCGKKNMWGTWQYLRLCKPEGSDGPKDACGAHCGDGGTSTSCACCSQYCRGHAHEECTFKHCGGRAEDQVSNVLVPPETENQQLKTMNQQLKKALKSMSKKESRVGGEVYGDADSSFTYCDTKSCRSDIKNCQDAMDKMHEDKDKEDILPCPNPQPTKVCHGCFCIENNSWFFDNQYIRFCYP